MGRVEELFDPGVEQEQYVQPDEGDRLDTDHDRDEPDRDRLDEAGGDHDPLAVVPVDVDAGHGLEHRALGPDRAFRRRARP